MARKTKKTTKIETPEEKLVRWIEGTERAGVSDVNLDDLGWEAGNEIYFEISGLRYEKFYLPSGGYIVIEWDNETGAVVLQRDAIRN